MNLEELRTEVESELQFAPQVDAHKSDMARLINAAYLDLMASKRWPFLQRVVDLELRPWKEGNFVGTCAGTLVQLTNAAPPTTPMHLEGHYLGFTDGGTYYEARIAQVLAGLPLQLVVDQDLGAALAFTDGVIIRRRFRLPADCQDVLGICSRADDRGPLEWVDRYAEEGLQLNDDEVGEVDAFMPEPVQTEPSPKATLAAAIAAAGALVSGKTYRYLYVWTRYGHVSARSNIVSATPSGANLTVDLSGIEATDNGLKRVYREQDGTGIFEFIGTVVPAGNTFSDAGLAAVPGDVYTDPGAWRYVRPWKKLAAVEVADKLDFEAPTLFELRYQRRVGRLIYDTDVPEFDETFHRLLVHEVVAPLAARHGVDALHVFHTRQGATLNVRFEARYFTETARDYRRRTASVMGRVRPGRRVTLTKV